MRSTILIVRGADGIDASSFSAVAPALPGASVTHCGDAAGFLAAISSADEIAAVLVPADPAFSTWRDILLTTRSRRPDAIVIVLVAPSADVATDVVRAGADDVVAPDRIGDLARLVSAARERRRAGGAERERARSIAETAADYTYSIGVAPDGRACPEWVSSGFERLTGFALCEVDLGLGYGGIAHQEDSPVLARREAALRSGNASDMQFRLVTRTGDVRFVRDRAQPVFDSESDRLVRVDGGAIDITALRRAEDEHRALGARLEAMLLQMPAGVIIAEARFGNTILSNPLAQEIGGGSLPPVAGAAADGSPLARSLRTGEVVTEEEHEIPRPDGTVCVIRLSSAPIRDRDGKIVEAIATFSDVTETTQIEKSLLESEKAFRTMFDAAAIGIVLTDMKGAVIESNPAFKRLLGHPPERLAELRFPEFVGQAEFQRHESWRDPVRSGLRDSFRFEHDYRRADGSTVRASVTVTLLGKGSGLDGYALAYVEDVTVRHEAEENMRQASRQVRLVADALPVLLSYIGADERYQFVNKTYEDWFGRRREEIVDRRISDLLPPASYEQLRPFIQRALAGETVNFVQRLAIGTGEPRDYDVTYVPDVAPDETVLGFFVHVADVTERLDSFRERRRLAKKLRRKQSIFAAVLEQGPAGLVVAEAPSGRLIIANERLSEMFRHPFLPTSDVEGYSQWPGYHPDGRPMRPEEWPLARAILNGEVVKNEEVHYERGDGSRAILSLNAAPIRNRRGHIVAGVVAVSDVTEERRLARDLARRIADFETLFDGLPMGIAIADDKECSRIRFNASALSLLGVPPRENFSFSSPPGERPAWRFFRDGRELDAKDLPMQRCTATSAPVLNDVMDWELAPGKVCRIRTHAAPLFDEAGNVRGCVATFEPVSRTAD